MISKSKYIQTNSLDGYDFKSVRKSEKNLSRNKQLNSTEDLRKPLIQSPDLSKAMDEVIFENSKSPRRPKLLP